jgi:hypothetical protein
MATKEKVVKKDASESNRIKRLERTLRKQPNNKQVQAALKTTRMRRKTPTNPIWTSSWRRVARIMKEFTSKFDPKIMSSNKEVREAAMAANILPENKVKFKGNVNTKSQFSISARAHDKFGNFTWN